jgi:hypothetical protein
MLIHNLRLPKHTNDLVHLDNNISQVLPSPVWVYKHELREHDRARRGDRGAGLKRCYKRTGWQLGRARPGEVVCTSSLLRRYIFMYAQS